MIVMPETLVKTTLEGALNYFRQNLSKVIPDAFGNLPSSEQAAMQTWFGNSSNQVFVIDGYPVQPQMIPCIAVTIGPDNQSGSYDVIGESWSDLDPSTDDTSVSFDIGMGYQANVICTILAPNQQFTRWLYYIAKWALMVNNQYLEAQGLMSQTTRAQELAPDNVTIGQEQVFCYRRVISITADHIDTVSQTYTNPTTMQIGFTEIDSVGDSDKESWTFNL